MTHAIGDGTNRHRCTGAFFFCHRFRKSFPPFWKGVSISVDKVTGNVFTFVTTIIGDEIGNRPGDDQVLISRMYYNDEKKWLRLFALL